MSDLMAVRVADRNGVVVRGKERISWLNGLVTCDLAKHADGAYGLLVEKKGKIQTDFYAVPGKGNDDALALAVPSELRDQTITTLDHYLIMEDAELEAVDLAFWHLAGAGAVGIGKELDAAFVGSIDVFALGEGSFVGVPLADADAFAKKLEERVNVAGGRVVDDAAWEAMRIERGFPRFGVELDATLYPQEASLEKLAVSFDKGCYLGQEVVYMLENRGHVKKKLVPLDIVDGDGGALAKGDAVTTVEGAAVGDVKSSALGPSGKPVAIAMVKWAQAKSGTELRVGNRVARVR